MNRVKTHNNRRRHYYVLTAMVSAMLTIAACSHIPLYSHYHHLPAEGWLRNDSIVFTTIPPSSVTSKNTVSDGDSASCISYGLTLGLRATNTFPYTQLMMAVHSHTTDYKTNRTDTITLNITDEKGNNQGVGTHLFQYDIPLPDLSLHIQDTLIVSVRHIMSRKLLPGITDIGLTVTQH